MKTILIVVLLFVVQSLFSQTKVTTYPPRYYGSLGSFSGNPTKSVWSIDTISSSTGARQISIDNSKGVDTIWYGFKAADTVSTKRFRLYPGRTDTQYWTFTTDVIMFWRSTPDSTTPFKWEVK